MPLKRYEIRNEYSLADPELYKAADKDDPEAILEAVAMSGLVGLLRQLGDLAEFAAEIFHDLHEEVMSTAARGHGLIFRVQQLEAEFPLIERKLLSQTSHTSFLYNPGVDWRSNIRLDQNTVTQGDLPRFVMDSYEECRGPPRLFLLDKFDVAGAGACLKRLTDPSFFKTESASSTGRKTESQREKKTRKLKKRGPRWRNGETPESFSSSHAKLHQLFLEERIESGGNDPDRHVKLKKRQFVGSLFDQEITKSYMEKFLETCPPEQRIVHEIIDPLPLPWTSHNASESSPEIVEIGTVSPPKEKLDYDQRLCSSPDTEDILEKPPSSEIRGGNSNVSIDSEVVEVLGIHCSSNDGNISSTVTSVVNGNKFADKDIKSGGSINDGCDSDDVASEINDYVDALASMDSEIETESEYKKYPPHLSLRQVVVDSDGRFERLGDQGGYMDSQSVSNSAASEEGNNLFGSDNDNIYSDHRLASEATTGCETKRHTMAHDNTIDVPEAGQEFEYVSETPCLHNTKNLSVNMNTHLIENFLQVDEVHSNSAENYIASGEKNQGHNSTVYDHPEKADKEAGQISDVYSDSIVDPHTTSDSLKIESHHAHLVYLPIDEHTTDTSQGDIDACSDSNWSLENPSISGTKCPEKVDAISVPTQEGFTLSVEGNTRNSSFALDSENSYNIREKHSDTNFCMSSPDVVATEHGESVSSSHSAVQAEKLPLIENKLEDTAPEESSSGNTDSAETVECSSYDSSENVINTAKFPQCADGETVDDSFMIGKLSSSPGLLTSENELQKLPSEINDAAVSEHCQASTDELDPGNETVLKGDPVSVGKVQNFISTFPDQTKAVEMIPHSDDIQTNAVDVEAGSDKIEDENIVFSNDTIHSDIPSKHANELGCATITENDADLRTDVKILEPIETVAYSSMPAKSKDDHAEIYQDEFLSATEECHQNGDTAEFTENENMNRVPVGLVDSTLNFCSASLPPPENVLDAASEVTSVYGHGVSLMPDNLDKDIQTPENVERDNHCEPFVSEPPPQSAEERLDTKTESSVSGVVPDAKYGLGPEYPVLSMPPSDHQLDLEPPPLPPLPPMQWRLGKFQNSSLAPGRQLVHQRAAHTQVQSMSLPGVHHTIGPAQTISPSTAHNTLPLVSIAHTSWNEGQPSSSYGYAALQGVVTPSIVHAVSEGFSQSGIIFSAPTSSGYMALQGGFTLPMPAPVFGGSSPNNQLFFAPSTSSGPLSGTQIFENFQSNMAPPNSDPYNGASVELTVPGLTEPEAVSSSAQFLPTSMGYQPSARFVASEAERTWLSTYDAIPTHASGNTNGSLQKKLPRPRNPLIDEVVAIDKSKMRKVERVKPSLESKADQGESLLEQMQLRKVEKVKPPMETNGSEGGYVLEHLQLRKVRERVRPPIEPKSEEREFLPEQLQLKKVGERYKAESDLKAEDSGSPRVNLRKVSDKVKQEIEARTEETGSPRLQLKRVGDRVKQDIEVRTEETGSPLRQLRKVGDRAKQEFEAKTEETESPRVQLKKVGAKTPAVVESKAEDRDSLLEQIRNKSFNLKPAVAARPNFQGPRTNLKVAAILEKASNIRQAMVGSDEDDDADTWE